MLSNLSMNSLPAHPGLTRQGSVSFAGQRVAASDSVHFAGDAPDADTVITPVLTGTDADLRIQKLVAEALDARWPAEPTGPGLKQVVQGVLADWERHPENIEVFRQILANAVAEPLKVNRETNPFMDCGGGSNRDELGRHIPVSAHKSIHSYDESDEEWASAGVAQQQYERLLEALEVDPQQAPVVDFEQEEVYFFWGLNSVTTHATTQNPKGEHAQNYLGFLSEKSPDGKAHWSLYVVPKTVLRHSNVRSSGGKTVDGTYHHFYEEAPAPLQGLRRVPLLGRLFRERMS